MHRKEARDCLLYSGTLRWSQHHLQRHSLKSANERLGILRMQHMTLLGTIVVMGGSLSLSTSARSRGSISLSFATDDTLHTEIQ